MSTNACIDAIETRLNDNWNTTEIAWPNVDFKPATGTAFISLNILDSEAYNAQLGSGRQRYEGVILIRIFVPAGSDLLTARTYADSISTIFNNQSFSGVVCGVGRREVGPIENGWAQLNLITPFYFDVTS